MPSARPGSIRARFRRTFSCKSACRSVHREPGTLQCALHFLQPPPQIDPAQSPHRAFHASRGSVLPPRASGSRPAAAGPPRSSAAPSRRPSSVPASSRASINDCAASPSMQMFDCRAILRLARRIEFLVGAFAGGTARLAGLHLRGRGQRPDQDALRTGDLRLGRSFHLRRRAVACRMLQLLAQHGGIDAQLLRNLHAPVRRARCGWARAECAEEGG